MSSNQPSTSSYCPPDEDKTDVTEDDDDDNNGTIDGIDVIPHLIGASNGNGANGAEDHDLVQAINMFMRNEYDYDEFMRVTGGQTLQEEMGSGSGSHQRRNDSTDEGDTGEEEEDDEDAELMEHVENHADEQIIIPATSLPMETRYDALPEEARYMMREMLTTESAEAISKSARNLAEALQVHFDDESSSKEPPLKQVKIEGQSSSSAPTEEDSAETTRDRHRTKRLDAMLGQANVQAARGNTSDAMELLREVIRQDHKHAMAYHQIATVYEQMGELQKALQFGLLASHLDPRTPAEDWVHWGDEARRFGMLEESAVCYDRALHLENDNWKFYEKRIEVLDELNLRPLAMRTRLQAAQMIDHKLLDADFQWFHDLIRKVAQYYITMNDEEKAILALEAFVLRSREFGEEADVQHETLVQMHLAKNKFQQTGKSIISLCKGIRAVYLGTDQPACLITYTNGTYECLPFPPVGSVEYEVDPKQFPVSMHCHLVVCLFSLNEIDQSSDLEQKLLCRKFTRDDEKALLDVARIYESKGNPSFARKFLEALINNTSYDFGQSGDFWYLKGRIDMSQKKEEKAMEAFEKVLILQPDHVDNRIHLSHLQQKAGLFERALETLRDYDLENCSAMPDERLLARQADVLFESGDTEAFIKTVRMMLAPHFYKVYSYPESQKKRRHNKPNSVLTAIPTLSNTLRASALNAVKHTNWERLVKRLGATVEESNGIQTSLSPTDLHDYCLKLIEALNKLEKHSDALIVCCYAFLHPMLQRAEKIATFQNLLYFCATKARNWALAFEYVRFYYTFALMNTPTDDENSASIDMLQKRLFNAMNYVFVNSQNVCYHRFIMRALVKAKDNHALQAISGNNSLITGTYRHAMGEYLRVWVNNKRNPLICLLLALTFTHMSCKKDLSSRHLICIRGIAFMKKYSKVRTCQQEVLYNIGRMFHQMSILPLAIHYYERVLDVDPPVVHGFNEDGEETLQPAYKYDLRKMAAHNLALIYRTSGNNFAAREIYEKYLVV